MKITKEIRDFVLDNYKTESREILCDKTGLTKKQITGILYSNGLTISDKFTDDEIKKVIDFYSNTGTISLSDFSEEMRRQKTSISRVANRLGLTKIGRPLSDDSRKKISKNTKMFIEKNGQPMGMLGKAHSSSTKKILSEKFNESWTNKYRKSEKNKNGSLSNKKNSINSYSRCKSGKRDDLGFFVRSSWEANYARYLKFLKSKGSIFKFEYEPDCFWFEKIRRGIRSYTPDFKVWTSESEFEYHEVKGWMDKKSVTKLKRMKKYYPLVKIVLIDESSYKKIKEFSRMIEKWE